MITCVVRGLGRALDQLFAGQRPRSALPTLVTTSSEQPFGLHKGNRKIASKSTVFWETWRPADFSDLWRMLRTMRRSKQSYHSAPSGTAGSICFSIMPFFPKAKFLDERSDMWRQSIDGNGLAIKSKAAHPILIKARKGRKRFGRNRAAFLLERKNNLNFGHPCGTCRFGDDPETSVLDRNNKAHGLDNLYVTDASFFPSSAGVNPSLTIAANALRVAEVINSQLSAREGAHS